VVSKQSGRIGFAKPRGAEKLTVLPNMPVSMRACISVVSPKALVEGGPLFLLYLTDYNTCLQCLRLAPSQLPPCDIVLTKMSSIKDNQKDRPDRAVIVHDRLIQLTIHPVENNRIKPTRARHEFVKLRHIADPAQDDLGQKHGAIRGIAGRFVGCR